MIKDRDLKELLYKHFRAQGWLAQIEVPVVTERGVAQSTPPVTDIDVLGIRPSEELRWRYVVGDCKTKKKESPVNRVLWATGLIASVKAASGIVLLKRQGSARIERDHKLFADGRHLLLLEEAEFEDYDKAIVYPTGSYGFPESINAIEQLITSSAFNPKLREHARWMLGSAWSTIDHAALLRAILGRAREVKGEIDPAQDQHIGLILETAAAFAVPFATLVGTVFRRYVKPNDRSDLEEAARIIIWGGREQWEFFNRMRAELAQSKGAKAGEPLALPEWDHFLEMLRALLESPKYAFRIPQTLRAAAQSLLLKDVSVLSHINDSNLLNLSLRLATYVARATLCPRESIDRLRSVFLPRIGEVLSSGARTSNEGNAQLLLLGPMKQEPGDG